MKQKNIIDGQSPGMAREVSGSGGFSIEKICPGIVTSAGRIMDKIDKK